MRHDIAFKYGSRSRSRMSSRSRSHMSSKSQSRTRSRSLLLMSSKLRIRIRRNLLSHTYCTLLPRTLRIFLPSTPVPSYQVTSVSSTTYRVRTTTPIFRLWQSSNKQLSCKPRKQLLYIEQHPASSTIGSRRSRMVQWRRINKKKT